jgi:hypothetical protein
MGRPGTEIEQGQICTQFVTPSNSHQHWCISISMLGEGEGLICLCQNVMLAGGHTYFALPLTHLLV